MPLTAKDYTIPMPTNLSLIPSSACKEAKDWIAEQHGTPEDLWNTCERADWMLWLATKMGVDRKLLVLAAADCAASAPNHKNVPTAVECVRVLRLWCEDRATIEEVRQVRRDAAAAAYAAADADAAAAADAYAAAYAADADYAAAYAADAAYADAATDAAYADAATDARSKHHILMCKLVRTRIPFTAIEARLNT